MVGVTSEIPTPTDVTRVRLGLGRESGLTQIVASEDEKNQCIETGVVVITDNVPPLLLSHLAHLRPDDPTEEGGLLSRSLQVRLGSLVAMKLVDVDIDLLHGPVHLRAAAL